MKSFTNFTIFFFLLVAGICAFVFLTLDITEMLRYAQTTNEIEKATHLSLIITYTISTISIVLGGSIIPSFLYQIKRIADNTEKISQNNKIRTIKMVDDENEQE